LTAIPVQIAGVYGANGEQPAESSDAIGVNAGASTGTVVATPGGLNTLGAWTELSASTTRTYRAVVVNFAPSATGGLSSGNGLLDVGVGGSGAEVVVATRLPYSQTSAEVCIRSAMQRVIPGPFPAGSRFAARYQATNTTQAPCMSLIGIPA
jgi:hypothetical protein